MEGVILTGRPYLNRSKEKDCWIGKFAVTKKFNISTNHLHYNKTAVEHVMTPGVKKIGIVREPESQFISSFSFYHGGLKKLTRLVNPEAEYHLFEESSFADRNESWIFPTNKDIEYEMEKYLERPFDWLNEIEYERSKITHAEWPWMATVRPQLLFFGLSQNGIPSWSEYKLNRVEVLSWLRKVFLQR